MVNVLAAHHTTDGCGFFLQRDGSTLLTLRSFNSFTEYDALRTFRADVGTRIGPEGEKAGQQYDQGDVAITYPHNSEVWSRNEAFDYHAPGPVLNEYTAAFMQMVLEQISSDLLKTSGNSGRRRTALRCLQAFNDCIQSAVEQWYFCEDYRRTTADLGRKRGHGLI